VISPGGDGTRGYDHGMTDNLPRDASAADAVATALRDAIRAGRWLPGDRLPPERTLAANFEVSRNTVREALGALSRMHIVDVRPGSGAYVTEPDPHTILDALAPVVDMSPDTTVLDILALRRIVEAELAGLAAVRATEHDVQALTESLRRMPSGEGWDDSDMEAVAREDVRFHELVGTASGSTTLSALASSLNGITLRVRVWRGYVESGVQASAHSDHEAILAAIRDHDPARATACAAAHVAGVERFLRDSTDR
jgi:GntR family transcriptional regulator, transcriptional repressor for pyruvate dehydrogenase complex